MLRSLWLRAVFLISRISFSQIAVATRQYHILISCTSKYSFTPIKDLKSDFRLFPNSKHHSLDQCKSDEKTFWGSRVGVLQWPKMALECTNCDPWSQNFLGEDPQTPQYSLLHFTNIHARLARVPCCKLFRTKPNLIPGYLHYVNNYFGRV